MYDIGAALRLIPDKIGNLLFQNKGTLRKNGRSFRQRYNLRLIAHRNRVSGQQQIRSCKSALLDRPDHQEINKEEENQQYRITDYGRIVIQTLAYLLEKAGGWKVRFSGAVKSQVLYADQIAASAIESDRC